MKKKRQAFTLAESLISLLIISAVGLALMRFSSGYMKTAYERDVGLKALTANISTAEELKAEVHSLPQLYSFSREKNIKIIAVGKGEIELKEDGTYDVLSEEACGFSERLTAKDPNLFRIEIGGELPNTKIVTVVMLRE
ncbi:MAG: type II secretion system protein [Clostridia bacterium]|nr:type II secretion system protein [Clostridia bacterium]